MATSSSACLVLASTAPSRKTKFRAGQLARCGGELVEVIEVRGEWATIKAFGNPVTYDRLVATLKAVR